MRFERTNILSIGYELAPNVVTSDDIEKRLAPVYEALHFQKGQLEALTGIRERRFWDPGLKMHQGATLSGKKALASAGLAAADVDMIIYAGVCRDQLEPATACAVSHGLGLSPRAQVYDVSNACLGVLNGMAQVAMAIELGVARTGLVVSCESARQIMDITIDRLLKNPDMETFKKTVATLTGGSGAVAVLLGDAQRYPEGHRLLGGAMRNAAEHHLLCTWGPDTGIPASGLHRMETDSVGVLKNGVALGVATYKDFQEAMGWNGAHPDRVVCHQVGAAHQKTILASIGIPMERDFTTFEYLGNMGTVSLPLTAAVADQRGFFKPGDRVGMLGIDSGLNCLMLGVEW